MLPAYSWRKFLVIIIINIYCSLLFYYYYARFDTLTPDLKSVDIPLSYYTCKRFASPLKLCIILFCFFTRLAVFWGGRHLLNGANLSRQFFSGPLIPPPKQPQKHCSPHRRARRRPCPPPPPPSRCRRNDIFGCVRVRGWGWGGQ